MPRVSVCVRNKLRNRQSMAGPSGSRRTHWRQSRVLAMTEVSDVVSLSVSLSRRLPPADIRRIASALLIPHGLNTLRATAGQRIREACDELHTLPRNSATRSLAAGVLLGSVEHDSRQSSVTPVWTGPNQAVSSRLTSAVVIDLVANAARNILIVGYAVHNEPSVTSALHQAASRGVAITLVVERSIDNTNFSGGSHPFPGLVATRLCWPANLRPAGASLHAKLLVVDDSAALVGSANMTGAALGKNLECGLLVRGGSAPVKIREHVDQLRSNGQLQVVN
ncbi:DISARM system phospholipase D-like protein DrmC [Rhodococcus sp. 14-1411-2a]|uniref:DISARM system phospholipase D-like protein DrmC n=1 Tax=Rhodococcus sp. 14-1411-2a TaxID=2023151 RepID=UPI0035948C43